YNYQDVFFLQIPISWGYATANTSLVRANFGWLNNRADMLLRYMLPNGVGVGANTSQSQNNLMPVTGDDHAQANVSGGPGYQGQQPMAQACYVLAQELQQYAPSAQAGRAWWLGDQMQAANGWGDVSACGPGWLNLMNFDNGANTRVAPTVGNM